MRRTSSRRRGRLGRRGDERRILVVANETVGGAELRDAITTPPAAAARPFSSWARR